MRYPTLPEKWRARGIRKKTGDSCWLYARLLIILVLALYLGGSRPAAAEQNPDTWRVLGGPVAFVSHLAVDPQSPDFLIIFLASHRETNPDHTPTAQGQLRQSWAPYFSNDGGDSWQPASNDLAEVHPTLLKVIPGKAHSTVWVGTENQGVWRSENGGRTWRPVSIPALKDQRVLALTVDTYQRLHLLTLDNTRYPDSHLYTSSDAGVHWSHQLLQRFTGDPTTLVTDLISDPFSADRLYAVTFGGLMISADGGATWTQSAIALPPGAFPGGETVFAPDLTQRGRLYLALRSTNLDGSDQLNIYRSLDSGLSWERLPATFRLFPGMTPTVTPRPYRLFLDPRVRQQLFLATHNGLWISSDAGLHWRIAGAALADVAVTDVWAHPRQRGVWYASGPAGIWRTANAGTQWTPLQQGLPVTSQINQLLSLNQGRTLLALNGGAMPTDVATGQPLWRSTDQGQTWMPAMRGLNGRMITRLLTPTAGPDIIIGQTQDGLVRSEDAGRSWEYRPLPPGSQHIAITGQGQRLYAGGMNGVWISEDGGETWQPSALQDHVQALTLAANNDVLAIYDTESGLRQIARSHDRGQTWQIVGAAPGGFIQQFSAHPLHPNQLLVSIYWDGLYVSEDGGRFWRRRNDGIPAGVHWRGLQPEQPTGPNLLSVAIDPDDGESWWASRDGGGVYHSTDGGHTWHDASGDLGDNLILNFLFVQGDLLATSNRVGILIHSTSGAIATPPPGVDIRLEILWPHDFTSVYTAQQANLGLRLYRARSLEPPPCAWTPNVEVWVAQDASPMRRLGIAQQRSIQDHPFPFWELNDIDVAWANDPTHKLILLTRMAPGQALSASSVWIHAADARTLLPTPPEPTGLTTAPPQQIDALIRVVWPHNGQGQVVPVAEADFVNISAMLVQRDTLLALAPDHLPERVWLVGALDNQVGRRLAVGQPRQAPGQGFVYTTFEFNNIDVSLARDPAHHWTFWLEVPNEDATSNVWVHGSDGRTRAPALLTPITGCQP